MEIYMTELTQYLQRAVELDSSDVFFIAGSAVCCRIRGKISPLDDTKLLPDDTGKLIHGLYELAQRDDDIFKLRGDDDFSFAIKGLARFRVSTYRQRGSIAAVIRIVAFRIPDYKTIGIPESVMALADVPHGLILCTGVAGSGKSTTQACLIDRINHTRACHVITLEDPIEFLHRNDKSIISQREIAIDTADCISGLRACLRQAPDVILLGEMRDADTIRVAMTAAETGHTVFATLHTGDTVSSIDRVIDAFPSGQQNQIRIQLASVLHTVISQQLLNSSDGKMVPAFEIMSVNSGIKTMIREGRTHQIPPVIAQSENMISMDQSLYQLYREGKITAETAMEHADNPEQLKRRL